MQISRKNLDFMIDQLQHSVTTDELHEIVEAAENAELRDRGWEMTCQTPGSLWLWHKDQWTVGRDTAIYFEGKL